MHAFLRFRFFKYSRSLKCPLHIASYAMRIGVSVMDSGFSISHTFLFKRYTSIARTGNFIMCGLGPFSRKQPHVLLLP